MKYGSVCSGIEAASCAWEPLGWAPAWFSEIEPFPCAVLKHHYPDVPNVGDMTKLLTSEVVRGTAIDLLVGGTPCQSFSVAGLRKGLADPRGNLALVFLAILDALRPRWVVWENVPGVLSSWSDEAPGVDGERWQRNDFDTFTAGLRELGYGLAWRVLDAQHFGIPQRRRRVFVVGYLGDWRPAAAVLFERHSLSGHPPPSRQAGQRVADSLTVGANQCSGRPGDFTEHPAGFEIGPTGGSFTDTAPTLDARCKDDPIRNQLGAGVAHVPDVSPAMKARDHKGPSSDGTGDGLPLVAQVFQASELRLRGTAGSQPNEHTAPTIRANMGDNQPAVVAPALTASNDPSRSPQSSEITQQVAAVQAATMQVRRLTPRECERLQGFPDDYTLIPMGKRNPKAELTAMRQADEKVGEPVTERWSADGPRYKALGNSMAVPVMAWLGRRIQMVDDVLKR